jgi:hypothetical protein
MFDKLKSLFGKKEVVPELVVRKPRKVKVKENKVEPIITEKEKATARGEPYVAILKVDIDPNNIHNGAFDLDWNEKFLVNLIKAGYKMQETDTDVMIVDRWFATICRGILSEMWEQNQADPTNRELRPINTRDLGNGRTEVS